MPQRILPALLVLGVIALVWMAWQAAPASAGFTPTPPPPSNTPVPPPPTNTPKPPPEKPPKDTPVPTATVNLTATPGLIPLTGGQTGSGLPSIPMLLAIITLVAVGAMIRPWVKTRR
jgi:hypothetical protein